MACIGVIAGLGAVVFFEALRGASYVFLQVIAGYTVPTPVGEGGRAASAGFVRPWAIPLVACVGALAGALLVWRVAPDAAGHGTDAAIAAVHHNPRGHPVADGRRQDRRLGADDRLRWLRGSRGTDGADQRGVRLVPREAP